VVGVPTNHKKYYSHGWCLHQPLILIQLYSIQPQRIQNN
jgi:hypothetical protein